jgi:hypothetical protein
VQDIPEGFKGGVQAGKAELEKAMEGHILSQGDLIGLYKKMK